MTTHAAEVDGGQRFEFGKNWRNFLKGLTDEKVLQAEASMREMLAMDSLAGKTFLDIGSGSGLFSLAARRLGAKVTSFDYDPESVACTRFLKDRFFKNDANWMVEQSSVLDDAAMARHRGYDIVYSYGVLHHTGQMWTAIENAAATVGQDGTFVISIYNDQGTWSRRWTKLKRVYNALPRALRLPYAILVMGTREIPQVFWATVKRGPLGYVKQVKEYGQGGGRGMSMWNDLVDWIGGYPFEVAKPEQIFHFFKDRGFEMVTFKTCAGGIGLNVYVLRKANAGSLA